MKVLAIALVPQGGGSNVPVWSAPNPAPYVNLEQLDELAEIIGNASVPAGTYSGAVLTVAANPGDVLLTVAENPESGFPAPPAPASPRARSRSRVRRAAAATAPCRSISHLQRPSW